MKGSCLTVFHIKRSAVFLLCVIMAALLLLPFNTFAKDQDEDQKVVRVGWFDSSFCYWDQFGRRCGLYPYIKLGNLLEQNLSKGTKGMKELLKNGYIVDVVKGEEIDIAYVFRANGTYAFTANAEHADDVARVLGLID